MQAKLVLSALNHHFSARVSDGKHKFFTQVAASLDELLLISELSPATPLVCFLPQTADSPAAKGS